MKADESQTSVKAGQKDLVAVASVFIHTQCTRLTLVLLSQASQAERLRAADRPGKEDLVLVGANEELAEIK